MNSRDSSRRWTKLGSAFLGLNFLCACACSSSVETVMATLGDLAGRSETGLVLGDTATAFAIASYGSWASCRQVDSRTAPTFFRWRSTESGVLQTDRNGLTLATRAGVTNFVASAEGVDAYPVRVRVYAPFSTFTLEPSLLQLRPGDTLQVRALARTATGEVVPGVPFYPFATVDSLVGVRFAGDPVGEHWISLIGRRSGIGGVVLFIPGPGRPGREHFFPVVVRAP
jgi:hypothetical protein